MPARVDGVDDAGSRSSRGSSGSTTRGSFDRCDRGVDQPAPIASRAASKSVGEKSGIDSIGGAGAAGAVAGSDSFCGAASGTGAWSVGVSEAGAGGIAGSRLIDSAGSVENRPESLDRSWWAVGRRSGRAKWPERAVTLTVVVVVEFC